MTDHGAHGSESALALLDITTRVVGVHRLDDGSRSADLVRLRGPLGSAVESEDSLRSVATTMRENPALDELALAVHRRALPSSIPLLTLVDRRSVGADVPDVCLTVDPRELARAPRRGLDAVRYARASGLRVCLRLGLDDLASALLPVVDPDLVIVHGTVLRRLRDPAVARLTQELTAYLQCGTVSVVADGVDTPALAAAAQSIGAVYGVGRLFDPAAPTASEPFAGARTAPDRSDTDSVFAIVAAGRHARRGSRSLLVEMGRSVEAQATGAGASAIVVRGVGDMRHLSHLSARRWDAPRASTPMGAIHGIRTPLVVTDVRTDGETATAPGDEWNVAVLGPHVCAALAARTTGEVGVDGEPRYEFVQTYDRATVVDAVRAVIRGFPDVD